MPGIVALVAAISNDVVAALSAASLPPLVDGAILLGSEHVAENSSPPRIVFVPTQSKFTNKNVKSPWTSTSAANRKVQNNYRAILTDEFTFDVQCWGVAVPPNPANDYDATQVLYQQVIRSIHLLTVGNYEIEGGEWDNETLTIALGRLFTLRVTFKTPVLDALLGNPVDVKGIANMYIQEAGGSPELAVTLDPVA
jgi:hypothetical protein